MDTSMKAKAPQCSFNTEESEAGARKYCEYFHALQVPHTNVSSKFLNGRPVGIQNVENRLAVSRYRSMSHARLPTVGPRNPAAK
jgi:hypothetical protein